MKEKQFRDLMKSKGIKIEHSKRVLFGWSASFHGQTIVCCKTLLDLEKYMLNPEIYNPSGLNIITHK